jgi:hypothetical protein
MLKKQKATFVFRLGLLSLLLSMLFGYFAPRMHFASQNWIDGIHGVLLGFAIGLMLLSMYLGRGGGRFAR